MARRREQASYLARHAKACVAVHVDGSNTQGLWQLAGGGGEGGGGDGRGGGEVQRVARMEAGATAAAGAAAAGVLAAATAAATARGGAKGGSGGGNAAHPNGSRRHLGRRVIQLA